MLLFVTMRMTASLIFYKKYGSAFQIGTHFQLPTIGGIYVFGFKKKLKLIFDNPTEVDYLLTCLYERKANIGCRSSEEEKASAEYQVNLRLRVLLESANRKYRGF